MEAEEDVSLSVDFRLFDAGSQQFCLLLDLVSLSATYSADFLAFFLAASCLAFLSLDFFFAASFFSILFWSLAIFFSLFPLAPSSSSPHVPKG